jgi:PAS domain S-box-containing protein
MIPSRDTALACSALPEVGALLLSSSPAWIWSRDGSRVLWANPAGGARLDAESFAALSKRRWAEGHQLRRAVAGLARALPQSGTLARLRLTDALPALPVACRCLYVRSGEARGVLVIAMEGAGEAPSLANLAAFFSAPETGAVILDEGGAVLAEGAPGAADARTYASPSVAFSDADRKLRLCFVDLTARVAAPRPREPAPVAREDEAPTAQSQASPAPSPPSPQLEPFPEMEPPTPEADIHAEAEPPAKTGATPAVGAPHEAAAQPAEPEEEGAEPVEHEPVKTGPMQPEPAAAEPAERSVMAGRVPRELSRKPVRFLWQTDAADRYLFVSPGLAEVVGRNADIVGERWHDAAARLRLDPTGRIERALSQHDTWSGLTAWWPVEGSEVRVPVELTALPVFGPDQSFQGYRGFGILRPAEALMPATFETRFGPPGATKPAEQRPPYEEAIDTGPANVVPIRSDLERMAEHARLSPQERTAFEEIAAALRMRVVEEWREPEPAPPEPGAEPPPEEPPVVDLFPGEESGAEPEPAEPEPTPVPSEPAATPGRRPLPSPAVRPASHGADLSDAERRLREMTAILDTATDGVVILDKDGAIESVNASAEALFGLEAHEMQGRQFDDLLTPETRQLALDYLSGLKDSGVASLLNEGREVAARAGAGSIPLFMTMGRISSEEGGRFCAVLRDITHWKRIEAELTEAKRVAEESSKQKSEFLARVSHEIRTPLNAIIGFAEVMIEERFGPVDHERYREYLRDIRASGEHVVSLVNDLLDISKIEAGKLDVNFTAVPLNDLVRECISLMQPQANRAHVVLRSSLSREVPAIVADERTMRQIVLNLLSNSVKYTGPGGQVIASTSLSETGEAILRVRDTGEGMSEEELVRALEPFRQLSTAAIGDATGTGLGLPLTKALVEANRASLSIRSARGEGTVVTVTIPPTRVLSE